MMQNTLTTNRLTPLQDAVLRTVAYSDLFDYPLTREEIARWLDVPATQTEVEAALHQEPLASMLSQNLTYVTLSGRECVVQHRERRARSSAALQQQAERYGRLIARLPFVRMVAVTGALAVANSDDGDDLDYLIVTAPGRVWLTRTMVMAVGRIAALRGVTLCPNYLLAETALALPDHDFYTARELLQMQPIAGHATYQRMIAANDWWRDFLPNATPDSPSPLRPVLSKAEGGRGPGGEHSPARRIAEAFLRLPPFDAFERWVLRRKGEELRRQSGSPEAVFDETMCKGHFDAWKQRTQERLDSRIEGLRRKLQDSSCSGDDHHANGDTDQREATL